MSKFFFYVFCVFLGSTNTSALAESNPMNSPEEIKQDIPPDPASSFRRIKPGEEPITDVFLDTMHNVPEKYLSEHMLKTGERLLGLGRNKEAVLIFRKIIAVSPKHLVAHERLRQAAIKLHRTDVLPDILVSLTRLYLELNDLSQAEEYYESLVLLAPEHPERYQLQKALGRVNFKKQTIGPSLGTRFRSLLGVMVILGLAWLLSSNRKKIRFRTVGWGLGLQLFFAVLILWTPPGRWIFDGARAVVDRVLRFTDDGAGFLFGKIYHGVAAGQTSGPMQFLDGTTGDWVNVGTIFAFHILPTIIFFGSLMAILYHLGIIQRVVRGIAWVMSRTMKTSGSESLAAASNIFVGQTEAPLVVKPYVDKMTRSELMAIMTCGFATVSGGVLAAFVRFGVDAGHLLAASVMSAPAALVMAKIMIPETESSDTSSGQAEEPKRSTSNVIDAAAAGAGDGLKLALNVGAMLMAFIALIAMLNWGIGQIGQLISVPELSLKTIFGVLFYPLSWCMGVDSQDLLTFGNLLGTKLSLNEFVAFVDLGHLQHQMQPRSFTIATYALCGFANFSSIGIQIGGISAIAPNRRSQLAQIGLKAMIAGALASWLTACIAGFLL